MKLNKFMSFISFHINKQDKIQAQIFGLMIDTVFQTTEQ